MLTPIQELVPLMLEVKRFFELGIPREGDELDQCENSPDNKAIGRLVELKDAFDRSLEKLLLDLSEINLDNVS